MKKRNKRGQFYLIATIIIVGLIIGLAVTFNYSSKDISYEAENVAKELNIEGGKVIDYDTLYSTNEFENFAREYSSYIGEDKRIYYILVEGANKEAYEYRGGVKRDLSYYVNVSESEIQFSLQEEVYNFDLGELHK